MVVAKVHLPAKEKHSIKTQISFNKQKVHKMFYGTNNVNIAKLSKKKVRLTQT